MNTSKNKTEESSNNSTLPYSLTHTFHFYFTFFACFCFSSPVFKGNIQEKKKKEKNVKEKNEKPLQVIDRN